MLRIYLNIAKLIVVENRATQDRFLRPQCVIFRCQKYVKKGYIDMTKKFTLRLLESVLGRSVLHYLCIKYPWLSEEKRERKCKINEGENLKYDLY